MALMAMFTQLSAGEAANEIAIQIIKGQPRIGYNVRDTSEEEKAKAAAYNSKMRLNWLMVNDKGVSEELRISYAIHLLDDALAIQKVLRSGIKPLPKEEAMMNQRILLGSRLVQISEEKQEEAASTNETK